MRRVIKLRIIVFLILTSNFALSQTSQDLMRKDLERMKFFFLNKNYKNFSSFLYPKVIELKGGLDKTIRKTKSSITLMEKNGYKILNIYFKDFNDFIISNNEIQTIFTEVILMDSPKGKMIGEYTMIGISADKGKTWKFINTNGNDENIIHHYFPNLNEKLQIKPKLIRPFDEKKMQEKCLEFKNFESSNISPIKFVKSTIMIFEDEQKEIYEDGSYISSTIIRNKENPCKIDSVIKDINKKTNNDFKIGDVIHLELTGFENNTYYYIATINNEATIISDQIQINKKLKEND